ncbi:MAG: hypothetical protein MZV70_50745 [Desulfobacterales bacterium]|nr:hypothetical protein [Desulfobacterales bacterium]
MGYSSPRKGHSATQPFYWAIDDRSDATFYLEYMSERGWKPGVEYRYFLTREAKGAIMFDYLSRRAGRRRHQQAQTRTRASRTPAGISCGRTATATGSG